MGNKASSSSKEHERRQLAIEKSTKKVAGGVAAATETPKATTTTPVVSAPATVAVPELKTSTTANAKNAAAPNNEAAIMATTTTPVAPTPVVQTPTVAATATATSPSQSASAPTAAPVAPIVLPPSSKASTAAAPTPATQQQKKQEEPQTQSQTQTQTQPQPQPLVASSSSSSDSLFASNRKAKRMAKAELLRKSMKATLIQSSWRGNKMRRVVAEMIAKKKGLPLPSKEPPGKPKPKATSAGVVAATEPSRVAVPAVVMVSKVTCDASVQTVEEVQAKEEKEEKAEVSSPTPAPTPAVAVAEDVSEPLEFVDGTKWTKKGDTASSSPSKKAQLMPNELERFRHISFDKIKRLHICIDGAINLPVNCTATRISARLLTPTWTQIGDAIFEAVSFPDSDACLPEFDLRMSFRKPQLVPFMVLVVRIDTLVRPSMQAMCVGYCALNILCDANGKQTPLTPNTNEGGGASLFLNAGRFLLPVVQTLPPSHLPLTASCVEEQGPPIGDAMLCVRVYDPSSEHTLPESIGMASSIVAIAKDMRNKSKEKEKKSLAASEGEGEGEEEAEEERKRNAEEEEAQREMEPQRQHHHELLEGTVAEMLLGSFTFRDVRLTPYLQALPQGEVFDELRKGLSLEKTEQAVAMRAMNDWIQKSFPLVHLVNSSMPSPFMYRFDNRLGLLAALDMLSNMPLRTSKKNNNVCMFKCAFRYLKGKAPPAPTAIASSAAGTNELQAVAAAAASAAVEDEEEEWIDDCSLVLDMNSTQSAPIYLDDFFSTQGMTLESTACLLVLVSACDVFVKPRGDCCVPCVPSSTRAGDACCVPGKDCCVPPAKDANTCCLPGSQVCCECGYKSGSCVYSAGGCRDKAGCCIPPKQGCCRPPPPSDVAQQGEEGASNNSKPKEKKKFAPGEMPDGVESIDLAACDDERRSWWGLMPLMTDSPFQLMPDSSLVARSQWVDKEGSFVNSGTHQLPLFLGLPPEEVLTAADPFNTLLSLLADNAKAKFAAQKSCCSSSSSSCEPSACCRPSKKSSSAQISPHCPVEISEGASAMVRLCNAPVKHMANDSMAKGNVVPSSKLAKRIFKAATVSEGNLDKMARKFEFHPLRSEKDPSIGTCLGGGRADCEGLIDIINEQFLANLEK